MKPHAWLPPTLALAALAALPGAADELRYEAKIAWLKAGTMTLWVDVQADQRYEVAGSIVTSRVMAPFLEWTGRLAAKGRFVDGFPHTDTYLLLEDDGDTREVLLAHRGKTTSHTSRGRHKEQETPPGSDLISVTFIAEHCLSEADVHDGERVYHVVLNDQDEVRMSQGRGYYSGEARRCDYRFGYPDGSSRQISVWQAPDIRYPVRVRVRIPLLPDGNLRLRMDELDLEGTRDG